VDIFPLKKWWIFPIKLPEGNSVGQLFPSSSWPKYTHRGLQAPHFHTEVAKEKPSEKTHGQGLRNFPANWILEDEVPPCCRGRHWVTALAVVWQVRIRDTEFKVRCADGFGRLEVEDVWKMCFKVQRWQD